MAVGDRGGASGSLAQLNPRQRLVLAVLARRQLAQQTAAANPRAVPDRHGLPADYGQSLGNSVHPHVSTPAEVAQSRAHPDTLASALKAIGALTGPVARDVVHTPANVAENTAYLAGQRKSRPKPPVESAVFYPKLAEQFGKSVAQDVTDPLHHKLNLVLDVAAAASGGASVAGKLVKAERALKEGEGVRAAARALKEPALPQEVLPRKLVGDAETGTRRVRVEQGHVQPPHQSPNIITAAGQHAFDRLSERIPNAPGIGAKARARRIIPEAQAQRDARAAAEIGDLSQAGKKIGSLRGTTAKEAAYSAIGNFGHGDKGVALLDADVARREKRIGKLPGRIDEAKQKLDGLSGDALKAQRIKVVNLEHELKSQKQRVEAWKAARPFVAAPHEHADLMRALTLGEAASKESTASRVARGKITAETAAEAENRHARLASGAKFVTPTPGRLGKESQTLKRARMRVASLERRQEQVLKAVTPGFRLDERALTGYGDPRLNDARVMRISSALSVAKDELQRVEKAAANRVEQTGLVGGENVTPGPGHFNIPDVEGKQRGRGVRTRSVNQPKDKAYQSTGALFNTGRNKLGPQVTVQDWLKETRFRHQAQDAKLAESMSVPYNAETFNPREHVLLNPQGMKVPRYLNSEQPALALDQMTPRELAAHAFENRKAWAQEMFPASIKDVPQEHLLGLRVIDKKLAEAITGQDRYYQLANSNALGRILDGANNLTRAAYIYLNPSYIPKNFAGNLGFLALQQGPFAAKNLPRSTRTLGDLSSETLRRIASEAGGGAAIQLAHEGRGFLAAPLQKVADIQGAGADRLPRIAAWLWEAHRRGYRTADQIEMLLRENKLRPVLTEVSEAANQAMVKFSRAPTRWRRIVGRAIFIAPWVEGATRYVGRLALDRPLSARLASEVSGQVKDLQQRTFGVGKSVTGARIPLGQPYIDKGMRVVDVTNPIAYSPTGQAFDVVNALDNALRGNYQNGSQLASFAQPFLTAIIEAATGIDTFRGRRYPKGTGALDILKNDLIGNTNRPAVPAADIVATALRKPQAIPSGQPPVQQPTYMPEGGLKDAAMKALLGSGRPVKVNLAAAEAKGLRNKLEAEPPIKRSYATVFQQRNAFYREAAKHGMLENGRLPQKLRDSFNLEAERQGMYVAASKGLKQGSVEYQRARYQADLRFLAKHKAISREKLTELLATSSLASYQDLKDARQKISQKYYQAEGGPLFYINYARHQLKKAGAKNLPG